MSTRHLNHMEQALVRMDFRNIIIEKKNRIGKIVFNRPEVLNALDIQSRKELLEALDDMERDDNVSVVVLTGQGDRAFSAGADLRMFVDMTPTQALEYVKLAKTATRRIETLAKPVIAAVNGLALGGGCEIALACDVVIASSNARFGQSEVSVGLIPGAGGTQRLPRIIGIRKAKELILTGEVIEANEAFRIGLVNRVVAPNELMDAVEKLAAKLKEKSSVILKLAKQSVNKSTETDLDSGLEYESQLFSLCFGTEDQKEGVKAFLEKRSPHFIGR